MAIFNAHSVIRLNLMHCLCYLLVYTEFDLSNYSFYLLPHFSN